MDKKYTDKEERLNYVSHGIGVIFGAIALILLLVRGIRNDFPIATMVGFVIYGVCIILMFLSSTMYHKCCDDELKKKLRVFDHSSIFLFIAGTYTPIILTALEGTKKWIMLIGIWLIALIGIIFKIATYGKFDKYKKFSTILYIAMGWLAVFSIKDILDATGMHFLLWILIGGLLYTFGTIFYANKKIPYNHAIWHLFVLAACVSQFVGILFYLA